MRSARKGGFRRPFGDFADTLLCENAKRGMDSSIVLPCLFPSQEGEALPMTTAPFLVQHTIHLSRQQVLEALRNAALAQARDSLRLTEPTAHAVELETRLLSGHRTDQAKVEVDGVAVGIEGGLPEDLVLLLRQTRTGHAAPTPPATSEAAEAPMLTPPSSPPKTVIAEMMAEALAVA